MGTYMTVVLRENLRYDAFAKLVNKKLVVSYGAKNDLNFNTWEYLQREADFMNADPEGLGQLPHFKRPITKETLHNNFFWLRVGEFSFKLSGTSNPIEALDAIAVCKWIMATKASYIDKKMSFNYNKRKVASYLTPLFEEEGYDLKKLWELPTAEKNNKIN
ncbi:hypothetical protein [Pedobacter sp. ASV28]|uniref:hypothetical protein n=1 Tax=Pedobacter sp. ASV28 TaxID=2795123 RepID=UPI0018EA6CAF|nr:hypothetical protein [Pedobacter sp. ASV28]